MGEIIPSTALKAKIKFGVLLHETRGCMQTGLHPMQMHF